MRGVGEHHLARDFDQRRAVHALHVLHRIERAGHRRHRRQERADIGVARQAHGQEFAVGIEREFADDFVIAAMAVGDKAAGALVGPFHRTAERARGVKHANVFGKHGGLHAERAADLAGQNAHVLGRNAERFGNVGAHAEHALRADIKREALAVIGAQAPRAAPSAHDEPAVDAVRAW